MKKLLLLLLLSNIAFAQTKDVAVSNYTSTAYQASAIIKAEPGTLYKITGYNSKGSAQFIQIFDSATLPGDDDCGAGDDDQAGCEAITGCSFASCDLLSETDQSTCEAQSGCTWDDPDCTGTSGACTGTVTESIPKAVLTVPATSNFSFDYSVKGRYHSTGIVVSNSSTAPTKTLGSDDCFFDVQYK